MASPTLHDRQRAQGGVFTTSDAPPIHFGDPVAEARTARDSTALFDVSDWSQIEIAGKDRQSFLHNFCTNDINGLFPGTGCEAFLTDIKGRILAHVLVCADAESLRLVSIPGSAAGIIEHLDRYHITEDMELRDVSDETAALCLVGPQAATVLDERFGVDVDSLVMYAHTRTESELADIICVPLAPQPAYMLCTRSESAPDLWQELTDAGVQPAGSDVWNSLRIAAGFPFYGVDISDENIAQEAGRSAQAISFTKGCYLGQEPIARLDALGHVNRLLCGLRLAAAEAAPAGAAVLDESGELQVGTITSSAIDYLSGGDAVALAMLKANAAKAQAQVVVCVADDMVVPATVVREGD